MLPMIWQRLYDEKDRDQKLETPHYRILVDRLWPRGIAKDVLLIDHWAKDICPSTQLRRHYHQNEISYEHFAELYRLELQSNSAVPDFLDLIEKKASRGICFLFASKEIERSHIPVLRAYIESKL